MRALFLVIVCLAACRETIEPTPPFIKVTVTNQQGFVAPLVDVFEVTNTAVIGGNPVSKVINISTGNQALPASFVLLFSEGIRGEAIEISIVGLTSGAGVFIATTSAIAGTSDVVAPARFCGDESVDDDRGEQCDDGNTSNGDGCDLSCLSEICGDGLVNNATNGTATETCDDGNNTDGDGCSACQQEFCGDSLVNNNNTEECDDGNNIESVNIGGVAVQIVAGDSHTCALLDTHEVLCWGNATGGALGYGNTNNIGNDELPISAGSVQVF